MIWREKRVLLAVLGVLLAANAIFFFTYRVQYQSRLQSMDARLEEAEQRLASTHAERAKAESQFNAYRRVEADVQEVYNHYWGTQSERLTQLIAEVKRLAVASNLVPASYAFDRDVATAPDLPATATRRQRTALGATEVGITFSVSGTYDQVRRLINLLELSRQFVIIDQIALAARDGQTLTLNLHVKTLFRDEQGGAPGKRL